MYILGISALYHDSAAALIRDGEIMAAAQEERFTRIKADRSVPVNAVSWCLEEAGIKGTDLDAVVYYDDPRLTLERYTYGLRACGEDKEDLLKQGAELYGRKLWIEEILRDLLKRLGRDDCLYVTRHHRAHAASAFYPSPFESAAILTVDGVGEWNTTVIGRGEGSGIRLIKKLDYPHSLGLFYSAFTYYCGFRVNYGDYKLMGLAPYGEPVYQDIIKRELIDIKEDGSFRLHPDCFDFQYGRTMINERFEELFGEIRRRPEGPITKRIMDIAASAQKVTEEVMLRLARTAKEITGEKDLVMAGGVALNCVSNGLIKREGIFDNIWIQPAAGDAGGALGAALEYWYGYLKNERKPVWPDAQKGSFLGPRYTDEEIGDFLKERNIPFRHFETDDDLCKAAARLLSEGRITGLFEGRMEYGPRALGHRSIIADPRDPGMQSGINLRIKYRESFRPFAPAVLAEKCDEYFDAASPYMLLCGRVKGAQTIEGGDIDPPENEADMIRIINTKRSSVPAVTHVDGSARTQILEKENDPLFYGIVEEFYKITGCPVIINTSLNVRGEPICCSPEDAYNCFTNTEMDALIMGRYVLLKEEQGAHGRRKKIYEPD